MTKEFEQIKQAVFTKRMDLDAIAQVNKQNEDNKIREGERIKEQQRIESEKRAAENRKILEDAGVVKIFEEIIESGLVKYSQHPILKGITLRKQLNNDSDRQDQYYFINYNIKTADEFLEKRMKHKRIADYYPAKIIWGRECESISLAFNAYMAIDGTDADSHNIYTEAYHYCRVDILSNKKIGVKQNIQDPNDPGTEVSSGGSRCNFKRVVYRRIDTETEITDLQSYIADKIINPN